MYHNWIAYGFQNHTYAKHYILNTAKRFPISAFYIKYVKFLKSEAL